MGLLQMQAACLWMFIIMAGHADFCCLEVFWMFSDRNNAVDPPVVLAEAGVQHIECNRDVDCPEVAITRVPMLWFRLKHGFLFENPPVLGTEI